MHPVPVLLAQWGRALQRTSRAGTRSAYLSLPAPGDGAPLCTSVAGTRPVHLPPAQRGGLRLPFPCGDGGELPIPTSCMKREVPLQGAATEGQRPKGSWPVKESSGGGERSRPFLPPPSPLPSGKGGPRLQEGPSLATPLEARCCALLPKAPPRPTACDRLARVGRCPPLSLCPSSPQLPCPHMGPVGGEKRAPAPTEGGRSSFETARSAF